jgi:hypothetical protein
MDVAAHQDPGKRVANLLADAEQADGAAFGSFGLTRHHSDQAPLPCAGEVG